MTLRDLRNEFVKGFVWGLGAGIAATFIITILRIWIDQQ